MKTRSERGRSCHNSMEGVPRVVPLALGAQESKLHPPPPKHEDHGGGLCQLLAPSKQDLLPRLQSHCEPSYKDVLSQGISSRQGRTSLPSTLEYNVAAQKLKICKEGWTISEGQAVAVIHNASGG
jgi:hypothetical protein